jgi:integrase
MALSDARIRTAKAKAHRYRLSDSHGLSIEVTPAGNKFWRYRYRIDGRENLFAAGEWCQAPAGEKPHQAEARRTDGRLTLAEARAARLDWRAQVRQGQHPRLIRAAVRLLAAQSIANTFKAVAAEFVERRGGGWSDSHRKHFLRFIEKDANPDIGALPIASLGPAHILAVLKKVEAREAYSVAQLGRGYLGQIFRYAIASHKAVLDPARALTGALVKVETKHHPPIPRAELGPFLRAAATASANRQTEIALRLLLLTMTRTVELRTAWWSEMDLAGAEWRLAAEKMKMKRPHIVPLSRQAVVLLTELRRITGNSRYLFPNARDHDKPMGSSTIGRVFQRAGYTGKFTPHGCRSTASTLLREAGFDDRLVELQLAHVDKNKSRASYDHAEMLKPRRAMMQAWADMVDAASMASPRAVR